MKLLVLYHGYGNNGGGEKTLFNFLNFCSKYCNISLLNINKMHLPGYINVINISDFNLLYFSRYKVNYFYFFLNIKNYIFYIYKIANLEKKINPDFIYVHDNFNKCLVPILRLFIKAKFVCHCHDVLKDSFIDKYLRIIYKNYFDKIIFPSEASLFSAVGSMSARSKVIKPMPLEFFPKYVGKYNGGVFNFLTIGMLDYVKGHDIVLHAIAYLRRAYPHYELSYTIVGTGDEFINLNNLAKKLNISENVKFLGYVENLTPVFMANHAVIIPSRQESFGLSFIEAALRGVPIIYSDVDALSENAEGFDLIKFSKDINLSCANAIIDMIDNYKKQISIAHKFRLHLCAKQKNSNLPSFNHFFNMNICVD